MAKDPSPQQWAASVLDRLGFKQTPGAIQALVGWARAEGGHWNNDAKYNPLNTTQPEPGAGNTGTQGNIKVYRDWNQGIDATVTTLKNGHYGGILAGLKQGDPGAVASAIDQSPWGTHGKLVYDTIGSTKVSGNVQPYASQPKVPHGASAPTTTTTPGTDNSLLRRQLVGQFLQQGGVANPQAVLSLAGSYGQAQDVPGTQAPASYAPQQPQAKPRTQGGIIPLGGSKNAGKGEFDISGPDPKRLQPGLVSFARKVASVYGGALTGLDGSTHSKYTVNGNVSEHYTGNASDVFGIGGLKYGDAGWQQQLVRAGRAALIAAGMPRAEALKQTGGLYNVGRHQIIFNVNGTQYGGNHLDHLHISTHAK